MTTTANGTLITMRADGTIRVPEETRHALHIEGETTMRLIATTDGTLTLQPEPDIPPEDTWAYTPEHDAAVERARHSTAYELSKEDLAHLITADDPEEALQQLLATKTPVDYWPPSA